MVQPQGTGDNASVSELVSQITNDLSVLMRKELELAQIEVKEEATRAAKGGAMFGAAAVVVFVALIVLALAAAWGLAAIMPRGVAFLLVGLVLVGIAAVLGLQGRKWFARFHPVPEQTVETLKEDAQWAKAQIR